MQTKVCARCGDEKPLFAFTNNRVSSDGKHSFCKDCKRQADKESLERRKLNGLCVRCSEPQAPGLTRCEACHQKHREWSIQRNYGLTWAAYCSMLTAQGSGCAICGYVPNLDERGLCVDHDHETGDIRALLCNCCNVALGQINDNLAILKRMIDYVISHSGKPPEHGKE